MNSGDTRYAWATLLFDTGDHIAAARELVDIVADNPRSTDARMLLARAYYHSAQLGRAERELRTIVAENPVDAYARLLLGRTLQRQSRHDEARTHLRLAAAMGVTPEDRPAGWCRCHRRGSSSSVGRSQRPRSAAAP